MGKSIGTECRVAVTWGWGRGAGRVTEGWTGSLWERGAGGDDIFWNWMAAMVSQL